MSLAWHNLLAWWIQIGLLAAAGVALPALFRLRAAKARLMLWHALLLVCVILPAVEPWRRSPVEAGVSIVMTAALPLAAAQKSGGLRLDWSAIALGILVAGALCRLLWLAFGLWRLRRYRAHAQELREISTQLGTVLSRTRARPTVLVSRDVRSPVTFGWRSPVVLLPPGFDSLEPSIQSAICCHELVHIRRRDWLVMLAEEAVRVLFWFHPAVWWLLARIQLAREQVVDAEVVRLTNSRERYLEALLAVAAARLQADLAPAPLFLRKRHLVQRVASIVKEVPMSKRSLCASVSASIAVLALTVWVAAGSFPLRAAPQSAPADDAGVTLQSAGGKLLHRSGIAYPPAAREKNIAGTVVAELSIDRDGKVTDARVLSGPDELRPAVLRSVLDWHYSREMSLPARLQVVVQFAPDAGKPEAAQGSGAVARVIPLTGTSRTPLVIGRIEVQGLPDDARDALMARLPVKPGDTLTHDLELALERTIHDFDEHLMAAIAGEPDALTLRIYVLRGVVGGVPGGGPLGAVAGGVAAPDGSKRLRVGGNVAQKKLLHQTRPVYPPDAKAAKIQGRVRLEALISKDGHIANLSVISGHPLLVESALEAVKTWVYEPTLLNGDPVEVVTQIDVNYTLSE